MTLFCSLFFVKSESTVITASLTGFWRLYWVKFESIKLDFILTEFKGHFPVQNKSIASILFWRNFDFYMKSKICLKNYTLSEFNFAVKVTKFDSLFSVKSESMVAIQVCHNFDFILTSILSQILVTQNLNYIESTML